MVYEVVNDELVVLPEISETMAKIEILDPLKVCIFFSLNLFGYNDLLCFIDISFRFW